MKARQADLLPAKIVLDGSNEALAVMLALEQAQRNNERRKRAQEPQA